MAWWGADEHGHLLDPEEVKEQQDRMRFKDNRCTPDKLLALIRKYRAARTRLTLQEVKAEFGGLLGAYIDYWQLKREGRI